MSQYEFSLLGFSILAFILKVIIFLLDDFLFSIKLSSHLVDLSISVTFDGFEVFFDMVSLLSDAFELLLQTLIC